MAMMSNRKLLGGIQALGIVDSRFSCLTAKPADFIIEANVSLNALWRKIMSPPLRQLRVWYPFGSKFEPHWQCPGRIADIWGIGAPKRSLKAVRNSLLLKLHPGIYGSADRKAPLPLPEHDLRRALSDGGSEDRRSI